MTVVDDLAGSMLVCMFMTAIMYGVTTTQTFLYYQNFPNDQKWLKAMVGLLWILDTIHIAFCIAYIYIYVIVHFGDQAYLHVIDWTAGVTVVLELVVAGLVHSCYVKRVWTVSYKNRRLTALIAFLAVIHFIFGITTVCLSYTRTVWTVFQTNKLTLATISVALSGATATDILVASSLIYFMEHARRDSGQSDTFLKLFMAYFVNTGAITTVISAITLISFLGVRSSFVWLGFVELQGKFYANSFLASLNARNYLRNKTNTSGGLSTWDFRSPQSYTATAPAQIPITQDSRESTQMLDTVFDHLDDMPAVDFQQPKDRPNASAETKRDASQLLPES